MLGKCVLFSYSSTYLAHILKMVIANLLMISINVKTRIKIVKEVEVAYNTVRAFGSLKSYKTLGKGRRKKILAQK